MAEKQTQTVNCNVLMGHSVRNVMFVWTDEDGKEEPRMLGLALIPGRHVVSICIDTSMPSWIC